MGVAILTRLRFAALGFGKLLRGGGELEPQLTQAWAGLVLPLRFPGPLLGETLKCLRCVPVD